MLMYACLTVRRNTTAASTPSSTMSTSRYEPESGW